MSVGAPRPLALARLVVYYLATLVRANLQVAWQVIQGPSAIRPVIVRVPVHTDRPWLVVTFANLISLTPGTLTLDVTEDRSALDVHVLRTADPDQVRRQLGRLEDRLLEALG